MMELLLALRDAALVGELAQGALALGAVGVLEPEGARDLTRADAARLLADEGEDLLLGRIGRFARRTFHEKWFREGCSLGFKLSALKPFRQPGLVRRAQSLYCAIGLFASPSGAIKRLRPTSSICGLLGFATGLLGRA